MLSGDDGIPFTNWGDRTDHGVEVGRFPSSEVDEKGDCFVASTSTRR